MSRFTQKQTKPWVFFFRNMGNLVKPKKCVGQQLGPIESKIQDHQGQASEISLSGSVTWRGWTKSGYVYIYICIYIYIKYCIHISPAPSNGWCLNPKGLLNGTLSHPFGTPWRVQWPNLSELAFLSRMQCVYTLYINKLN